MAALLTVREVAERLRVHEETIRQWLREGKIKGQKMGRPLTGRGEWRIDAVEVDRFLEQGREDKNNG